MGKRFIFILMACSLLSIATVVHAQHIDKQTYIFAHYCPVKVDK